MSTAQATPPGLHPAGMPQPTIGLHRSGAIPQTSKRLASRKSTQAVLFGTIDFVLVWIGAITSLSLRLDAGAITHGLLLERNAGFLLILSILVVLFCHTQQLYEFPVRTFLNEAGAVAKAVGLATMALCASIYLSRQEVVSRVALGITVVLSLVLLVSWRYLRRQRMLQRIAAGQCCHNVLILGWNQRAEALERYFEEYKLPGYVIKGFLDRRHAPRHSNVNGPETLGSGKKPIGVAHQLSDVVRAQFIDEILVFLPEDRDRVKELIVETRRLGINLRIVPDSYDGLASETPIEYIGPYPAIQVHEKPTPLLPLILKRTTDVVGSSLALLFSLPLSVAIALAILLDSPGPILYRSDRVGRKGSIFTCYKFRTMVANAEALGDKLREFNERSGVLFKMANDPRITPVGRILRKYSLDEIPQFWNVLAGDMSLVGPRPPIPGEYRQYELEDLKRLHVAPGITGLWQVEARTDPSFESYINLDKHYVDNWSVWLDLKILIKTIGVVVAGTGQ
jgi:exopolysaccharide biosynthesis polyprenyl glycosylphosphotransferase